ncbi:MAG: hypothetical protein ACP5QN_03115 [Minisyncoccia bacterium]
MKNKKIKLFKKGDLIIKILEILQTGAETTATLLDIFTSNYYNSYRKIRRSIIYGPSEFKSNWADNYLELQKFYNLLNRLKKQGFIQKQEKDKKSIWSITKLGLEKLKILKKQNFPIYYKKEKENSLMIVTFDIPEQERYKRDWLRNVLVYLDFKFLQQSVWIGKTKIPEEFIENLREQKMLNYVHIFKINKAGTIIKKFN